MAASVTAASPVATAAPAWAEAYRGRRVLITGHTGFKGSWLAMWLAELGADVWGYSLAPPTEPSLFETARVGEVVRHHEGDVRDHGRLAALWRTARPEIVFHLAAQPLVRESYRDPLGTLSTNVMGTAHVLDLARRAREPLAVVAVTSDKCYENREWVHAYRETDPMGGHDVYSASKGAAELVIASYRRSFCSADGERGKAPVSLASVRAGNVVGGGDWAADRIVPDCIRALAAGRPITVRNPRAVRPWQHVLEPLSGYLQLGARLLDDDQGVRSRSADAWNFGPETGSACAVCDVVERVIEGWGAGEWTDASDPGSPHEAALLRLATDKAHAELGWRPRWDLAATIARTVDWYRAWHAGDDMAGWCRRQIADYCGEPIREPVGQ